MLKHVATLPRECELGDDLCVPPLMRLFGLIHKAGGDHALWRRLGRLEEIDLTSAVSNVGSLSGLVPSVEVLLIEPTVS